MPSALTAPGDAEIVVVRDGLPSRASPLRVVPASFGAFSRNGHGWGPGDIRNADGQPNTLDRSARPGETVTLKGTGLGIPSRFLPTIVAGARKVRNLRRPGRDGERFGVDELIFDLPGDVPDGCYVPVQVLSASGITSNTVTLAVNRRGGGCPTDANWIATRAGQLGSTGLAAFVHFDLLLVLSRRDKADFPMDLGYASFESHERSLPDENPLYMFPPPGSCMNLAGFARTSELLSPLGTLDHASGARLLDAGPDLAVEGPGGARNLLKSGHSALRYSAVLGGTSPAPGTAPQPLFLRPGDYRIFAPGGSEVGPQSATVRVGGPLQWINRSRLAVVDRSRGALVEWKTARPDALVVILAMNAERKSGALGVCSCVERSSAGRFRIPPEMLANVPASTSQRRGLPVNLMLLAELPSQVTPTPPTSTLDGLTAFWASGSGRSVDYR